MKKRTRYLSGGMVPQYTKIHDSTRSTNWLAESGWPSAWPVGHPEALSGWPFAWPTGHPEALSSWPPDSRIACQEKTRT